MAIVDASTNGVREQVRRISALVAGDRACIRQMRSLKERVLSCRQRMSTNPLSRRVLEQSVESLSERLAELERANGSEEEVQSRLAAREAELTAAKAQLRQRPEAPPAARLPAASNGAAVAASRERERLAGEVDGALRDLQESRVLCARLERAIGGQGSRTDEPGADTNPPSGGESLSAKLSQAEALAKSLQQRLMRLQRLQAIKEAIADQEARSVAGTPADPEAAIDALRTHLRMEFARFTGQVETHYAGRLAQILADIDRQAIAKFDAVDRQVGVDIDSERIALRPQDTQTVQALLRYRLWMLLQTYSQLLPDRCRLAFGSARVAVPGAEMADRRFQAGALAARGDLQVPALPSSVTLDAVETFVVVPSNVEIGRVPVPVTRLWRRGRRMRALGTLITQTARTPATVIAPLAVMGMFVGERFSAQVLFKGVSWFVGVMILAATAWLTLSMLRKRDAVAMRVLLDKGQTMLREDARKRGEQLWQAWRHQLDAHLERSIGRSLDLLRDDCAPEHQRQVAAAAAGKARAAARAKDAQAQAKDIRACDQALKKAIARVRETARKAAASKAEGVR